MPNLKTSILICCSIFYSLCSDAQDYTSYYLLINKAEQQFVTQQDSSCFATYDKAFAANTPFLKDPYIAAQIAFYLGDTVRFQHYLGICFSNGMPLTAVNASPLLRKGMDAKKQNLIHEIYQRTYSDKKVDSELNEKICMLCYQSDSNKVFMGRDESKIQLFYASENFTRKYLSDSLLPFGKFPNEHLLNITSDQAAANFYNTYNRPNIYGSTLPSSNKSEYELRVACPYNILLHSHCFYQDHKEELFNAVKKGYLHPKEYGILEETSILWYKKDNNQSEQCNPPESRICYNILGVDPTRSIVLFTKTAEGLAIVEQNRKSIFMQSYAIDQQKKEMETKYGFAFFFDFIDRQ